MQELDILITYILASLTYRSLSPCRFLYIQIIAILAGHTNHKQYVLANRWRADHIYSTVARFDILVIYCRSLQNSWHTDHIYDPGMQVISAMYTLTLVVFSCSLTWNSLKAFLVTLSTWGKIYIFNGTVMRDFSAPSNLPLYPRLILFKNVL